MSWGSSFRRRGSMRDSWRARRNTMEASRNASSTSLMGVGAAPSLGPSSAFFEVMICSFFASVIGVASKFVGDDQISLVVTIARPEIGAQLCQAVCADLAIDPMEKIQKLGTSDGN